LTLPGHHVYLIYSHDSYRNQLDWAGSVIPISHWYLSLGNFSFPTVFIRLRQAEIQALLANDTKNPAGRQLLHRLHEDLDIFPGAGFISADVCAPTDSPHYRRGGVSTGRQAWDLLATSKKVTQALREGQTEHLTLRPYRRMDPTREFRMFIRERKLLAMSQYFLIRHFARLDRRQDEIWKKAENFAGELADFLPVADVTADLYLCSNGRMLLVDLNPWGPPTDPLLFRNWERNWSESSGLKLISKPMKMKGEISVSF